MVVCTFQPLRLEDTSRKRTAMLGPNGVRLREVRPSNIAMLVIDAVLFSSLPLIALIIISHRRFDSLGTIKQVRIVSVTNRYSPRRLTLKLSF